VKITEGKPDIRYIHRKDNEADIYFVANIENMSCNVICNFSVSGRQPELWDPIWGTMRDLPEYKIGEGKTSIPLEFAPCQSFFIIFQKPIVATATTESRNFQHLKKLTEVSSPWIVSFDPKWGGPERVTFEKLEDWTKRPEPGIKYYSGTAVYQTTFDVPSGTDCLFLDLGEVRHLAHVRLNGQDFGVLWTPPWRIEITGAIKNKSNELQIEVTNVWANRLIGDEQEPADCQWLPGHMDYGGFLKELPEWLVTGNKRPLNGRYCFTTWNYFNKDSPLVTSGLIGPVTLYTR